MGGTADKSEEKPQSRWQKFKNWVSDHKVALITAAVVTAVVLVSVVVTVATLGAAAPAGAAATAGAVAAGPGLVATFAAGGTAATTITTAAGVSATAVATGAAVVAYDTHQKNKAKAESERMEKALNKGNAQAEAKPTVVAQAEPSSSPTPKWTAAKKENLQITNVREAVFEEAPALTPHRQSIIASTGSSLRDSVHKASTSASETLPDSTPKKLGNK